MHLASYLRLLSPRLHNMAAYIRTHTHTQTMPLKYGYMPIQFRIWYIRFTQHIILSYYRTLELFTYHKHHTSMIMFITFKYSIKSRAHWCHFSSIFLGSCVFSCRINCLVRATAFVLASMCYFAFMQKWHYYVRPGKYASCADVHVPDCVLSCWLQKLSHNNFIRLHLN